MAAKEGSLCGALVAGKKPGRWNPGGIGLKGAAIAPGIPTLVELMVEVIPYGKKTRGHDFS